MTYNQRKNQSMKQKLWNQQTRILKSRLSFLYEDAEPTDTEGRLRNLNTPDFDIWMRCWNQFLVMLKDDYIIIITRLKYLKKNMNTLRGEMEDI